MPRIRYIKPQFWLDEDLATVPRDTRLLYIGLWNLCDDYGVFEWRPGKIKAQLFPYDSDISQADILTWLTSLQNIGNITFFENHNGKAYGFIPTFKEHQPIKKPSQWRYPSMEGCSSREPVNHQWGTSREPVSLGEEGGGKREKVRGKSKKVKGKGIKLPDFIDKEVWDAFLEMRVKMRKAPTDKAKELLVKDLEKLHASGDDANEVLNQSIKNNWAGVFPLKGGQSGTHKQGSRHLIDRDKYTNPEDYRS